MNRAPMYETSRYVFYTLRVGSTVVRKRDNKSVYFQPGDATSYMVRQIEHVAEHAEMYDRENDQVFNLLCAEYF